MKRILFTVALCLAVTASFAQKKAVKDAERIVKGSTPDFNEARTLIKGALDNAETKDDARTWFVAGSIEDKQFSSENAKQVLGQKPNEPVMYEALIQIYPYFLKAYELDQKPNEKGKMKPKYTKDIKSILSANHVYYINGGAYYFDQKDYTKAHNFFDQYLQISNNSIFQGEKIAEKDSNYMQVQFYAAVAATQMGNRELAIEELSKAKELPYRQNDVYQYLCYEYEQAKDTVGLEKVLQEGLTKFPEEKYYLMSLINIYIYSNQNDKAIDYLNTAIQKEPSNALLYDVLGKVYETGLKDIPNAEKNYIKANELDPENTDFIADLGRVYFNQGVTKLGEANSITDSAKYQEESTRAKDLFKKALPYFEKVHKIKPDDRDCLTALRGIYYNLNMGPQLEKIEALINQ